jgi:hypothetical protein
LQVDLSLYVYLICIFKLDSTKGECKVVVAWHIERGYFGNDGINLDNLNTVYAIYAPGNMFTGPKWKLALYIDDKASEQQKDAFDKDLFRASRRLLWCRC